MEKARLTPPAFDSERRQNQFVATLWLHNLISDEDSVWLQSLGEAKLSDAQAKALVVARRSGSVSNAVLRSISGLDTLSASRQLRQLRDLQFLKARGKGEATYYILGPRAKLATPDTGSSATVPQQAAERTADRGAGGG